MKPLARNLLLLAAAALAAPWFFPRRHRVIRRALIRARVPDLFPLLDDLRNWPRWTAWSQREELHFTYEGAPSGPGAVQRWQGCRMNGMMRLLHTVPDRRLNYECEFADGRYHLEGIISLEPLGEFTRVTWICTWAAGPNPYRGYFDLVMRKWIGHDFAKGLDNLRALAERR